MCFGVLGPVSNHLSLLTTLGGRRAWQHLRQVCSRPAELARGDLESDGKHSHHQKASFLNLEGI